MLTPRIRHIFKHLLKAGSNSRNFKMSNSRSTVVKNNGPLQRECQPLGKSPRTMSGRVPLYSFGIVADIHFANIPDGKNYPKTRNRYYRNSLSYVKTAVSDWTARAGTDSKIRLVLDLGDLIDGFNAKHKSSISALKTVHEAFDPIGVPVIHIWGNHDLYNFTRKELHAMPEMNPVLAGRVAQRPTDASEHSMYFDIALCQGFRLVVLDCYEVSMLGVDEKSDECRQAEKILREVNKNEELNSFAGLPVGKSHFVKFNGAMSPRQLLWLDGVLRESKKRGEVVLVAGHIPLCCSDRVCLCWNYEEILQVLHRHSCVLAYFAGHAHDAEYMRDDHGIHHLTVQGVIEVPPGANAAHLNVHLCKDRVFVMDERTDDVFEFQIDRTT